MTHARSILLGVATTALLVAGCAGPARMLNTAFSTTKFSKPATNDGATTADSSQEPAVAASDRQEQGPSLSQVLDDIERLKHANPSDLEVIRSAIESEANLFPPQYQQLYKDQMMAVAANQRQQATPPSVAPRLVPAPIPQVQTVAYEQPSPVVSPVVSPLVSPAIAPARLPASLAVQPPIQLPVSGVAPTVTTPPAVAATLMSTAAPVAAVTTSVTDTPQSQSQSQPQSVAVSSDVATAAATSEIKPGQWSSEIEQALTAIKVDLSLPNLERDERARLEIVRRLLYVATNQRDNAISPIDQLDEDEAEYWKHQLLGLMVSIDADGKHPTTRRAALALRNHRTAIDHLANVSTLDVRNLSFCQEVFSYGKHRVFDSYSFRAKDEVVLYVEIDNFAAVPRGDSFETELHASYEILDDAGRRVANVVLPVDKEVSNNRRRDYFIAYIIKMPAEIASGSFRLRLTVEDVIGKKSNHATVDFRIR